MELQLPEPSTNTHHVNMNTISPNYPVMMIAFVTCYNKNKENS